MKKLLSVLAATSMIVSLAACGSSAPAPTTAAATTAAATEAATTAAAAAAETQAAAAADTSAAANDPVVHLTFAHADSPDGSVNGEASKVFAKLVEEKSGGSIIIDVYPSAQLGTVAEAIQGVQNGSIDMTQISTSFLSNFCPEVGVFDMPFLFEDYQHVWDAEDEVMAPVLNDKLVAVNLHPEFWSGFGFRNVTTSKNRVLNGIDDLKGLRIRIQPSEIQREIFTALEADPAPIDWGELYTALQQGTVDAQENPFTQIYSSNIYEVNPVIYKTEHEWGGSVFITSMTMRDKLTDNQKAVFDECLEEIKPQWRQIVEDLNNQSLQGLKDAGCEYKEDVFNKADLQAKVQGVYDNHPEYAELVEKIKALR